MPRNLLIGFLTALAFLTRFPIPSRLHLTPIKPQAAVLWAYPLVGAVIGGLAAVAWGLAHLLGLSPHLAALLSLMVSLTVTGALHEDGLADFFDAIGGGQDRDDKLRIMRDSRLGTFGALALMVSVLGRWAALASLPLAAGATALVAAHMAARGLLVFPLIWGRPARQDGLGAQTGRPDRTVTLATLAAVLALPLWWLPSVALLGSLLAAGLAMSAMSYLAKAQIGGYTGDSLGAAEQAGELAFLITAAALLVP